MAKYNSIPIETLRQLLICDPIAGTLTWRFRPREFFKTNVSFGTWNAKHAGKPALSYVDKNGYCVGPILGKMFKAHRVIFAMVTGEWPIDEIDHEKGSRTDNRFSKMKPATGTENHRNMKKPISNTTGVVGVYWFKRYQNWTAEITVNRKKIFLGYFTLKADAIDARKAAEIKYGFHPNHGRVA